MRNFITIVEKIHDSSAVFDASLAALKGILTPDTSYETAKYEVMKALQAQAEQFADPQHPVKVLIDFFPHSKNYGQFSSHDGEGWLIINMLNMVEGDWGFETTPEEAEQVAFRIAQTFAHEMTNYEQYCRNWKYHENKNGAAPYRDIAGESKAHAADAARELVRHYGSTADALAALKHNTRETALVSPSMRTFLSKADRDSIRRFLAELYGQLDLLRARGQ